MVNVGPAAVLWAMAWREARSQGAACTVLGHIPGSWSVASPEEVPPPSPRLSLRAGRSDWSLGSSWQQCVSVLGRRPGPSRGPWGPSARRGAPGAQGQSLGQACLSRAGLGSLGVCAPRLRPAVLEQRSRVWALFQGLLQTYSSLREAEQSFAVEVPSAGRTTGGGGPSLGKGATRLWALGVTGVNYPEEGLGGAGGSWGGRECRIFWGFLPFPSWRGRELPHRAAGSPCPVPAQRRVCLPVTCPQAVERLIHPQLCEQCIEFLERQVVQHINASGQRGGEEVMHAFLLVHTRLLAFYSR